MLNNILNLPKHHYIYGILLRVFFVLLTLWSIGIEIYNHYPLIALKALPLIICLYSILKLNNYGLQWGIIILHLYLFEGLVSFSSSKYPHNIYGLVTLVLFSGAYIFSLMYIYPYKKLAKNIKKYNKK